MSEHLTSDSLSRVLAFILGGNTGIHVLTYVDKHTFADLWLEGLGCEASKIADQQVCWNDKNAVVLISGEDPPNAVFEKASECLKGINFRDLFTASSWLATWK